MLDISVFSLKFTRLQRLITQRSYRHVFRFGTKLLTNELIVLHCNNDYGYPRLGMAISRKHVAKAVNRNRIKRAIREGFRQQVDLPAVDIVVIFRRKVTYFNREELYFQLQTIWKKLILLCKK